MAGTGTNVKQDSNSGQQNYCFEIRFEQLYSPAIYLAFLTEYNIVTIVGLRLNIIRTIISERNFAKK